MTACFVGESRDDVHERIARFLAVRDDDGDPAALAQERSDRWLVGTVDELAERIEGLRALGVTRVFLQHLNQGDDEMLALVGERLLPVTSGSVSRRGDHRADGRRGRRVGSLRPLRGRRRPSHRAGRRADRGRSRRLPRAVLRQGRRAERRGPPRRDRGARADRVRVHAGDLLRAPVVLDGHGRLRRAARSSRS